MSVLNENVIIASNNADYQIEKENNNETIVETMVETIVETTIERLPECRVCGDNCDSIFNGPLKKYCKCLEGSYHTKCFKNWIIHQKSLQCDVCYQYFLNVDMTTKTRVVNGKQYIIFTLFLNLVFIFVIWLFYYSSADNKCEMDPTDQYYSERCVNYKETQDAFYIANVFITIMISLIACILCLYFRETGLIELEYFHVILVE